MSFSWKISEQCPGFHLVLTFYLGWVCLDVPQIEGVPILSMKNLTSNIPNPIYVIFFFFFLICTEDGPPTILPKYLCLLLRGNIEL